ncbi:glycosyltransferase [Pontibacter cellulosilyticus]|uniref:Glycosyltransferase n=1 Tax=Pontibacter cellulosilyticus TaxID=1720253 RepID=A0A923SMU6_9BACT|nr:glycosyltransferase [Pontibacter cellulosilyticus]MBC5992530.1 glycosyltransferase [Pontibacter cellulosilyticus]
MNKVLLSAYACDPSRGSEYGNGWNWAYQLALKGYEVHVITTSRGRKSIEEQLNSKDFLSDKLVFHFIDHSNFWAKAYYKNFILMYVAYFLWQLKIFNYVKKSNIQFDLVHHVTWGSLKVGSALYKLNTPFVYGPVGGGHTAPLILKKFLYSDKKSEWARNFIGVFIAKINPLTRNTLKHAKTILATNAETLKMAKSLGGRDVNLILDAALPKDFGPSKFPDRNQEKLVLLWLGRIYAFKGLGLVLESLSKVPQQKLMNIELHVVGDGPFKDEAEKLSCKLGLQPIVKFHGSVPFSEVKKYYLKANAFIYCSLRDSCPAQVLEAQAFGLPVITLDLHGQSLLVQENRGIKCPVGDPLETVNQISKAIILLEENPLLRVKLGAEAFKFGQSQIWEAKVELIIKSYY